MTGIIYEPARAIDVIHKTEVLVVGSGPSGLAAALASARAGAATTLLERLMPISRTAPARPRTGTRWPK